MRRSRFGENPTSQDDNDYADNTKYDEKYIMPTNAVTPDFGTSSVYAAPDRQPSHPQAFTDPMRDGRDNTLTPSQSLFSSAAQNASGERMGGYGDRQSAARQAEAPMVFALRSDPTLYVYEYSDRLEYYRKTPNGMMMCNVEYKKLR